MANGGRLRAPIEDRVIAAQWLVPSRPVEAVVLKPRTMMALAVLAFVALIVSAVSATMRNPFAIIGVTALFLIVSSFLSKDREQERSPWRHWRGTMGALMGADGIAFGGGFLRYGEIERVEPLEDRFVLHVGRPDPVVIIVPLRSWEKARVLIEEGRHARTRVDAGEVEALLRRGEETDAAWSARIDALRVGGSAYRATTPERSRLWRVAQDAGADPFARVAACTLLECASHPEERTAIAAIRSETAHPALRRALDALDTASDDAEARAARG
jgi:hypothetical protein